MKNYADENNNAFNKIRSKMIKERIHHILDQNNDLTTLGLKNELRNTYPYISWTQETISKWLNNHHEKLKLTYSDNGQFRVYTKKKSKKSNRISKSDAIKLIQSTSGRFFSAGVIKKDGSFRVLNGKLASNEPDDMGYFKLRLPNGQFRQLNTQTLQWVKTGGIKKLCR